tara:strand:- start:1218 stop:1856 length:639 start_codon:yes stop_codon:yes gene_type:complete
MSATPMDTEQPININISRTGDSSDKYNSFKEYLIINNLDLQNEVKELKNEISSMKIEINEKEITEDKTDASIRYLRGLVNNLNEIKKSYAIIDKDREHLVNDTNSDWNNIFKISEKYHVQLLLYNLLFMIEIIIFRIISNNRFRYILAITLNIIVIYTIGLTYMNYYNNVHKVKNQIKNKNAIATKKIKDVTTELIKLEESTLALDSWIYEV